MTTKRIFFSLLTLSLIQSAAIAEPGKSIEYLMNKPATLFDLGTLRVSKRLESMATEHSELRDVYPNYDWDENRFYIDAYHESLGGNEKALNSLGEAKEKCTSILWDLRVELEIADGNRPGKEAGTPIRSTSAIPYFFDHIFHSDTHRPDNLGTELDKITVVRARTAYSDKTGDGRIVCQGPLVGTDIFYDE